MSSGSVSEMKAEKIQGFDYILKAYPNPVVNSVTIHADNGVIDNKAVSVFDMTGKKYETRISSVSNQDIALDFSNLTPGVYNVRLKVNNEIQVLRILKQ